MAIWSRLTAGIAALGIGRAGAIAIEPALEPQRQEAWKASKARVLALGALAEMVAQGLASASDNEEAALRNGFTIDKLEALAQVALTAPGTGELDRMLNRKTISRADFNAALAKHKVP